MGDFRTFHETKRLPAKAGQKVIDPAGWDNGALQNLENWSYQITASDVAELAEGVAAVKRAGVPITGIKREHFPLKGFASILADVRRELTDGRGLVMLQQFPVDEFDRESTAIAYFGLGQYLGRTIPQNGQGHVLGHVKDIGADYRIPTVRGYMTRDWMGFHTDSAEYVGLLCLQTSKSGGESLIASSVTVYNRILERRPDLLSLLTQDWYSTQSGEIDPGDNPWTKAPVFAFVDGYFSAGSINLHHERAQGMPGVPTWTDAHREAMDIYKATVMECALEIPFQRGDIQFLNNHVMLHTRRAYDDFPEVERKRPLLRLWLQDPVARPIPEIRRKGRSGQGVVLKGVEWIAPLDVEQLETA